MSSSKGGSNLSNAFLFGKPLVYTYVLNFINRKVIPNEKNLQIIFAKNEGWNNGNKNDILLQFAQTQNNEYILDFKYPFNNITAFALALSCLSSRTFCK